VTASTVGIRACGTGNQQLLVTANFPPLSLLFTLPSVGDEISRSIPAQCLDLLQRAGVHSPLLSGADAKSAAVRDGKMTGTGKNWACNVSVYDVKLGEKLTTPKRASEKFDYQQS